MYQWRLCEVPAGKSRTLNFYVAFSRCSAWTNSSRRSWICRTRSKQQQQMVTSVVFLAKRWHNTNSLSSSANRTRFPVNRVSNRSFVSPISSRISLMLRSSLRATQQTRLWTISRKGGGSGGSRKRLCRTFVIHDLLSKSVARNLKHSLYSPEQHHIMTLQLNIDNKIPYFIIQ